MHSPSCCGSNPDLYTNPIFVVIPPGEIELKIPTKNYKTRYEFRLINGDLFKETFLVMPVLSKGVPIMQFEGASKFTLNVPRYKKLVALLKQRNAFENKFQNTPAPSRRLTKAEKIKLGLLENETTYTTRKTKKYETLCQKHKAKTIWFRERLSKEFEYYKLIQFHNPNEAGSRECVPFFDLRFVLQQEDLKKWSTIIQLELEYNLRFFSFPKRGQPKKDLIYTRQVFWTYLKFLAYAMENRNKPEITRNPPFWAAEKTIEQFPTNNIKSAQLIKMGKEFLLEQRKKDKQWSPQKLAFLVQQQGAF